MTPKERIIQYIESEGISKYKFYKQTGLGNGFLDKESNISIDKYSRIFSQYPNLNPLWVKKGEGPMINTLPPHMTSSLEDTSDQIMEELYKYMLDEKGNFSKSDFRKKYFDLLDENQKDLEKYSNALQKNIDLINRLKISEINNQELSNKISKDNNLYKDKYYQEVEAHNKTKDNIIEMKDELLTAIKKIHLLEKALAAHTEKAIHIPKASGTDG